MLVDKSHLTYCTNIHSGETWTEHFAALKTSFPEIKNQVSPDKQMGIGLRLSHIASLELSKAENLREFQQWLNEHSAYVFTMNGFPYGGFHDTRVKDQVHAPDWTTHERVDYTIRLFNILKELLPNGVDGGISTSPLSYRHWFGKSSDELLNVRQIATLNILKVVEQLILIKHEKLQVLHLDIEPEPDGILETGIEFIEWFENELLPAGISMITEKFGFTFSEAEVILKNHVRLCYDVCHFAIGYEPHKEIIHQLELRGIKIGKIQISAAIKAQLTSDIKQRELLFAAFSGFNEQTYLHQVVARRSDGAYIRYRDLPEALVDINNLEVEEWRAHFHVPIFVEQFDVLYSTQNDIFEVLKIQNSKQLTTHLEVETYTWEVLPENLKIPLQDSIVRELKWVNENFFQKDYL
ncbi:MAG: metabolite traffic protein EboE [Flavobacterium sp.]|nr:metabolite traffic protein EboE [Pedobacter sp.]